MRPSDVINITKVYFEATKFFGESLQQRENEMADLTPDELRELDRIVGEIESEEAQEEPEEGSEDGEEGSEDAEGEQD